jgi:hypothetical protein
MLTVSFSLLIRIMSHHTNLHLSLDISQLTFQMSRDLKFWMWNDRYRRDPRDSLGGYGPPSSRSEAISLSAMWAV